MGRAGLSGMGASSTDCLGASSYTIETLQEMTMQVPSSCSCSPLPRPASWQIITSGYQQIQDRRTICDQNGKVGAILKAQSIGTESEEVGRWRMEGSVGRLRLNNPNPHSESLLQKEA